ncbi:MAG: acetylglutamate kinase [Candidatus Omnitrophica bacterium]|nr:acetylglutamate kinase [Candidatus Omnitrophota bacterium]
MEDSIRKADVLIEALPYIQRFAGKTIVVKYGGSALSSGSVVRGILEDLVFLSVVGLRPVLLHGGGPAISQRAALAGKATKFIGGMRVTDQGTVEIVNEALEEVNRNLVEEIQQLGGRARGLVVKDRVIIAQPHPDSAKLGYVGLVKRVEAGRLHTVLAEPAIPVVSPIGSADGQLYNINADEAASQVASSLRAEKLVLLTNVRGILRQAGDPESLIPTLTIEEASMLIERAVIQEGMIPKVRSCISALKAGVGKTHIIDAAIPHALLLEIFTKTGIGTEIVS